MSCSELAPIKINVFLHVVGKRENGYHNLQSLFVFGDSGDSVTWLGNDEKLQLSVDGPFAAQTPVDDSNLVLRAARLLKPEATGHLLLTKNVPVASGLGGGSADAAATLRLLNRVWTLGYKETQLLALAGQLGADVPACLRSQPCYVSGIGETVTLVSVETTVPCIVINPLIGLSTAAVFQALARRKRPFSDTLAPWPPLNIVISDTRNDLQPIATHMVPETGQLIEILSRKPGCTLVRMSGSGASCFGLFETHELAKAAYSALLLEYPGFWLNLMTIAMPKVIL